MKESGTSSPSTFMVLKVTHFIDAAHQLKDTDDLVTKKCTSLHGHTYRVDVTVIGRQDEHSGLLIDFARVKDAINILDHKFINEVFEKKGFNRPSTAECIAEFIAENVLRLTANTDRISKIVTIRVYEGYKGEHTPYVEYTT